MHAVVRTKVLGMHAFCECTCMHENPCVDVCVHCRVANSIGQLKLIIHFKRKFVDIKSVLVAH